MASEAASSDVVHSMTPEPDSDEYEQSSEFPPPARPPLPSQPFPMDAGARYRVGPASDDSDSDEEEVRFEDAVEGGADTIAGPAHDGHASSDEEADNVQALQQSRARAGRAARVGRGSNADVIHISSESDSDSDDETSMIIHSDNPHGHKTSLSHGAIDHFASPQPPHAEGANSPPPAQRKPPPLPESEGRCGPPPKPVYAAAASSGPPPLVRSLSANGTPVLHARVPSKEEVATIDFYVRQAIQAKDLNAMHDLVARANEKGVESDLVSQARSLLLEARAEARDNEISTLKHYMKQSIEAKQKDACLDILKKAEVVAASLSTGPHRRLYADFFTLIAETQHCVEEQEKEDAQTVNVYLKQGLQLRSREVLQAALGKATSVRHNMLDQQVLAQAKQLLTELDSQVMLRNFLGLAIKNREQHALEESIAQANKLALSERDAPELAEAKRLLEDLRLHPHAGGSGHKERERAQKDAAEAERKERKRLDKQEKEKEKEAAKQRDAAAHLAADGSGEKKKEKHWFNSGGGKKTPSKDEKSSSLPGPVVHKLFGGSLQEAVRRNPSGQPVPRVVEVVARYLREAALQEPGLFRVAGNKGQIDQLRDAFEDDYKNYEQKRDPPALTEIHDASGVFKLYFRMLPEPLIPFDAYPAFIKVGLNKGADRVAQLAELVTQLPKENYSNLSFLCAFLLEVSTHVAVNKMSPDNLAIVFAPNLIRPRVETPSSMIAEMPASISVIASLIASYHTIFTPRAANGAAAHAAAAASAP